MNFDNVSSKKIVIEPGLDFSHFYLQIMLSERPEYNNKVKAGFLLAPVAFMTHSTSSVFLIAEWGEGRNVFRTLVEYWCI